MATKLNEGDTVALQGEVTIIHEDGMATVHFHGYDTPVTIRAEHLSLVAKKSRGSGCSTSRTMHDTSTAMIEKHYSGSISSMLDDVAKAAVVPLVRKKEPAKVVPIRS